MTEKEIFSNEIEDEIDYNKTIELNKLVVKNDRGDKIFSYIFLIIVIGCGGILTFLISKFQLQNGSLELSDYFISYLTPVIFIILSLNGIRIILGRNKLREITSTINQYTKKDIIDASVNLKWNPYLVTDNYIRINTKFSITKDIQTVTIVFSPDNKIYFNSIHFPNDYVKPSRFDSNYQTLTDELAKLRKALPLI
jgi:hypothetical protein